MRFYDNYSKPVYSLTPDELELFLVETILDFVNGHSDPDTFSGVIREIKSQGRKKLTPKVRSVLPLLESLIRISAQLKNINNDINEIIGELLATLTSPQK